MHRVFRPKPVPKPSTLIALAAVGALALSSCSSSNKAGASGGSGKSLASITISAKDVPGVGTVLVNGEGRTLYLLTSEQGGKVTCTDDNGCTKVWPDTELPAGTARAIAGSGITASLLGTTKDPAGSLYVTYGGYPLYEYTGDPGPGRANGQGIQSFGGTWYAITPSGAPASSASPATTAAGG